MEQDVVRIEQRLQDQPRIALLSLDEAIVVGFPIMIGLLSRRLIAATIVALILWQVWKRVKGDGGLHWVLAAMYWFIPKSITAFRTFPDSAVERWRG